MLGSDLQVEGRRCYLPMIYPFTYSVNCSTIRASSWSSHWTQPYLETTLVPVFCSVRVLCCLDYPVHSVFCHKN